MTNLSALYDDLEDVVVSDVKGSQLSNNDLERLEDNPDAWYDILVELKREVELQLTDKRRELHQKSIQFTESDGDMATYLADYNEWRVKVLRFLASIEKKLRLVKRIRKQAYDAAFE